MKNPIIVALDVSTLDEAVELIGKLPNVEWFKVGAIMFTKCGPALIDLLKKNNKKIMLDLKYHDIPNTVELACYEATKLGVDMLTIHLSGGSKMIKGALKGVGKNGGDQNPRTKILGISVLTSIDQETLNEEFNIDQSIDQHVDTLVQLGVDCKIDGIVCSSKETKAIREKHSDLIIVNPGTRLIEDAKQDQKRVTTPGKAIKNGASFLVVGRAIINASDPQEKAKKYIDAGVENGTDN